MNQTFKMKINCMASKHLIWHKTLKCAGFQKQTETVAYLQMQNVHCPLDAVSATSVKCNQLNKYKNASKSSY